MEAEIYGVATFGTGPSGLSIEVVSEYRWSQEQASLYLHFPNSAKKNKISIKVIVCHDGDTML
jgi:hypothetical protein